MTPVPVGATYPIDVEPCFFTCQCIGSLHAGLLALKDVTVGRVINVFDTTVNIRMADGELLVLTLGKVRSPANLNMNLYSFGKTLTDIVGESSEARVIAAKGPGGMTTKMLAAGNAAILLDKCEVFQTLMEKPKKGMIDNFAIHISEIISELVRVARACMAGSLLNPDITTRGLLAAFLHEILYSLSSNDKAFAGAISRGFLGLCGRGPGFTPAGDDFIAGFLAGFNWLSTPLKCGTPIIPGGEYLQMTTWTSFKLMEYSARNLLDEQVQEMINSIARNEISEYVRHVRLLGKRGHTSGIDLATGMTAAFCAASDRTCGTKTLNLLFCAPAR